MPIETTDLAPQSNAADLETRDMLLNIGPAHPAMHGIIRIVAKLDGERIQEADVEIGYLHRAFEKMSETVDYNGVIPYTDRLNYVSPLINNMGYCMTVEKLLGISVPERCHYVRVILSEISRITDHLTCVGASAMELGAFTVFLYMIKAREYLWDVVERARRDMPRGPVQVHPETGRSIPETGHPMPAAEMVDLAKVGNIVAIAGDSAVTCPTLEGSGRASHPSIATGEKRVFLPPKE